MRYRFITADVFTDRIFGGNQLAVFPDAAGLTAVQMQQITREFNLSETAFVLPPEGPEGTFRLRIFTPGQEIPFAGHPTIGTAHVLAAIGKIDVSSDVTEIVFEENVGLIQVKIRSQNGRPVNAQLAAAVMPEFGPAPPARDVLAGVLSLEPGDILDNALAPEIVSCGVPFLFVPVANRDALRRARVDMGLWQAHLAGSHAPHLYLLTEDSGSAEAALRVRMFAPAMGITEDPATGAAAAALAGYLGRREAQRDGVLRWTVHQGFEMGRPSVLEVEAEKKEGAFVAIRVGGASVLVSEGMMRIPAG